MSSTVHNVNDSSCFFVVCVPVHFFFIPAPVSFILRTIWGGGGGGGGAPSLDALLFSHSLKCKKKIYFRMLYVCMYFIYKHRCQRNKKVLLTCKNVSADFRDFLTVTLHSHKCVHLDPAQAGLGKTKTLRCMRRLVCCI